MKSVRIQIDYVYNVQDDIAEQVFDQDAEFYEKLRASFWSWAERAGESRIPQSFDLNYALVDMNEEIEEK